MEFSKFFKYLLTGLLIFLNFVIRIPSIPHEKGVDSFGIHILAGSISIFGYAKWWVNSLSIFGLYPYSYASSVPFILSGISQCTGVNMEQIIWMYGVIIGLLSIFTAYMLAKAIWNNDIFKFLTAFLFSLSPGILTFSTWDATTRGLFMVLLPLFICLLLKTRTSIKYGILTFILFILLMATHHYFYFLILIILSLIVITIFDRLRSHIKFVIPYNAINLALIFGFLGAFLVPFFTGIFIEWSRYDELYMMFRRNMRYSGIPLFFAISGLTYLSLKYNKKLEEWFLLLALLFLTVFLYVQTYIHYIIIIFICILSGVALTNIAKMARMKKYMSITIIIILLLSIGFSAFYQHWRTHIGGAYGEWYLDEEGHAGALWIRDNIDMNKRLVGNNNLLSKRIFAISGVPVLLKDIASTWLIYEFTKIEDTPIVSNSPLSTSFYFNNPYVIAKSFHTAGWYRNSLQNQEVNSKGGKSIIQRFNLSYVIEDEYYGKNRFIQSLYIKDSIYDNGKVRIWCLD